MMIKFDHELFVKLYLLKYGLEGETPIQCSKRCIEEGIQGTTEDNDFEEFKSLVVQCIKTKYKKEIDKQIGILRLNHGPHFIYN